MIETVMISYLSGTLQEPVYAERPKEEPPRYYIVEKTGSHRENRFYRSTYAIQSIVDRKSGTLLDTIRMNEALKEAMLGDGFLSQKEITKAELNSDYNFTDPEAGEYKYQAVFDINHY